MGRTKCILQSEFPYNISARCINKEWFSIPMDEVWKIFCEELNAVALKHGWVIHSFVLMSNHFHLIVSTPDANVSVCMHQFMQRTSRRLTRKGNRLNQTYAGRHYKCILHNYFYCLNAYKYNYRNPVTAGICDLVEDYKYSSLQFVIGKAKPTFPLLEDLNFRNDPAGTMKWLNTAPPPEKMDAWKCGVRRQYFKSKLCKNTKRPILAENDML